MLMRILKKQLKRRTNFFFSCLTLFFLLLPSVSDSRPVSELEEFENFANRAGITVTVINKPFDVVDSYGRRVSGNMASEQKLKVYLAKILPEFLLYPEKFCRFSGVHELIFCDSLTNNGHPARAFVDDEKGRIFYNVNLYSKTAMEVAQNFHHEFFHVVDRQLIGGDEKWLRINKIAAPYWNSDKLFRDLGIGIPEECMSGYLLQYSRTNYKEDKAVMFEMLLTHYEWVEYRADFDSILRDKTVMLKSMLHELCPGMDMLFWKSISARCRSRVDGVAREELLFRLDSMQRLSDYLEAKKRYSENTQVCKNLLFTTQSLYGSYSWQSAERLLKLGQAYEGNSNLVKAKCIFSRALSVAERVYPKDSKDLMKYKEAAKRI